MLPNLFDKERQKELSNEPFGTSGIKKANCLRHSDLKCVCCHSVVAFCRKVHLGRRSQNRNPVKRKKKRF